MSELATISGREVEQRETLDPRIMESLVSTGDLSKLNPTQRVQWYHSRCAAAGLDPRCQPFEYVTFQGKLQLYAKKTATDQLTAIHRLKVEVISQATDEDSGLRLVNCRATFPDGRYSEDLGAVSISGLRGEALANAMMKAVTKAKRRTILSACGLGMLDETEVESLEGVHYGEAKPPPPQNDSGYGRGQYASPDQIKTYKEKVEAYLAKRNAAWLDKWTGKDGEVPNGCKDICNLFQADGHLLKWAVETQRLDQTIIPDEAKMRQLAAYVAIVWHRDEASRKAVGLELKRYCDEQEARQTDVIRAKNPEMFAPQDEVIDVDLDEEISATEGGRDG